MKKCEICGSTSWVQKYNHKFFLCRKHRYQYEKYGEIRKRTIKNKNEIIDYGKYCEIILYNRHSEEITRGKFDSVFKDKIKKYKWCRCGSGYISTTISNKALRMHTFILGNKNNKIIDHINANKLDNRISNLRFVTYQQNHMNQRVLGFSYDKKSKKWRAYITLNDKQINLGYYETFFEAMLARIYGEFKYFGKYSHIADSN
jgi:hypothetical protein